MNNFFDTVVIIPVGPNSDPEFIIDTIESFIYYTHSAYKIILSDNSKKKIAAKVSARFPEIDVLHTSKRAGFTCDLYISLSHAYQYALQKFNFNLLLKLDTDALIIGDDPEKDAYRLFNDNKKIGLAGQYRQDNTSVLNIEKPVKYFKSNLQFIKKPIGHYLLHKLQLKANANGYQPGKSIFGGAYFMSSALLKTLKRKELLPDYNLANLNIGEDDLFSILAVASGFQLGNLAKPAMPLSCTSKTLSASPEQLKKDDKKIIHSVRSWKDMNESSIRYYFQSVRMSKIFHLNDQPVLNIHSI